MRLIPTGGVLVVLLSLLRFFDTMYLLISVSKKLSLNPSLHVWRCVEDADGKNG